MTDRLPAEEFRAVLMGEHPRLDAFRRRLRLEVRGRGETIEVLSLRVAGAVAG